MFESLDPIKRFISEVGENYPPLWPIVTLTTNFIGFIAVFNAFVDITPLALQPFFERSVITALLFSIITTIFGYFVGRENSVRLLLSAWGAAAFIGLLIVIASLASLSFNMPEYVEQPEFTKTIENTNQQVKELNEDILELKKQLETTGLTESQIAEITKILESEDVLTADDIPALGLSEKQLAEIEVIIVNEDLTNSDDVKQIIAAENTRIASEQATATAVAYNGTCFLELDPKYSNVGVRQEPDINSTALRFADQGDQFIALGHDGGTLNTTLWWLVEIRLGANDESDFGWISSSVVEEINPAACTKLGKYGVQR